MASTIEKLDAELRKRGVLDIELLNVYENEQRNVHVYSFSGHRGEGPSLEAALVDLLGQMGALAP